MPILATALAALYLPVPIIMLWLHLPRRMWRRWGPWSYALHAIVYAGLVIGVIAAHPWWSRHAPDRHPLLAVLGATIVAAGFVLLALTYRHIDTFTAMAVPQLLANRRRPLLTSGVYGVVRHPRYLVLVVGALGNYLMVGTTALLLALVVAVALTVIVVRVEEAELVEYFGDAYRSYAADVPAIIPRFYMKR